MKIKYTREERKRKKERLMTAESTAKDLVRLNFSIDTEMFARKEAGASLGAETGGLNIVRQFSLLPPFQDWAISFRPNEEKEEFSLGHFILHCHTEELNHHIELKNLSPELIKIVLEQPEIRRFSETAKDGMRKALKSFNSHFSNCLESLSQEKRELAPILVSKEIKIVRLARASTDTLNILNRFRWIFPVEVVVGKSSIDEAKETLGIALATK